MRMLKNEWYLQMSYIFFNLCVPNSNLSDNILYAKHIIATKMLRTPHIFYSLSHIKAQFMVSSIFLIDNFFIVTLERNDL